MSDEVELSRVYDKYLESAAQGFPVWNDSFLQSKIPVLRRPIESLEGFGHGFNFNNFWLQVFLHMDRNIDYLAGEFNYSDDEFKMVAREYTRGWYYGEVFVAYGQGYINQEILAAKENIGDYDPCAFDNVCKWRLYRRVKLNDGTYRFHSLISNVPNINLDISKLVRVTYQGIGVFIQWLELAKDYVAAMGSYLDLLKLSTTRYKLVAVDEQVKQQTVEAINGWSMFYEGSMDFSKDAEVKPQELCLPEHPQMFLDTLLNYYAEGCRRMGFVFSSESKSERQTSGEHYRALKMTSNIQNHFLSIQQNFTRNLKIKFPDAPPLEITLAYDVTGQGIPDNNKNVKKKWRFDGDKDNFSPKGNYGAEKS